MEASILWRRLDAPGHDACRLQARGVGWLLEGTAAILLDGLPARLSYAVACDQGWQTEHGRVRGWVGSRSVRYEVVRSSDGTWMLNEKAVAGLESCVDLDLAFTPATNLLHLRRVALPEGLAADFPVAWFDVTSGTLRVLPQHYERRSETSYWYASPTADYAALLEVSPNGFVRKYPGLWEEET